ncbi:S8 family peptidase [Falsibacillus albus]|uniref:S8 family peptidase n=1 Tax=Falsibacillus albus TaxID=2478915 RepID=UPI0013146291|nr:S8 family serine peptidase [Falsibacillus albus]
MNKWTRGLMAAGLSAGIAVSGVNNIPQNVLAKGSETYQAASLLEKNPLVAGNQYNKDHQAISDDTLVIKYTRPFSYGEYTKAGTQLLQVVPELNYAIVKVLDKSKFQNSILYFQKSAKTVSVKPSAMYTPLSIGDPKADIQYMHQMLHTSEAQKLAGKNKVVVAVVDQGVDPNHPELASNLLPSYNAVNPMNQGMPDFHGTHVAGIIAAKKDNGIGGFGINPNVKILSIDVFNRSWGASDFSIAQGILTAVKKGANIINLSLGGPVDSPIIREAVEEAIKKNIVVVAAAGNSGDETVDYPAAYEGVISVGSVNSQKQLSDFSSYGPSVDLVAPGEDIYSTLYDYEKKSTFASMSGTSMAAPVVSGAASLLLSKYPKLSPAQVEYILEHTADDLGAKGFDVKYGYGLINLVKALKFNTKNIPSLLNNKSSVAEKIKRAVPLKGAAVEKGAFVKPFDEKLYKMDVKEGQQIQVNLSCSQQYDYKMELHFVSNDQDQTVKVNDVREGKEEGKMIKAPFSGTLLISVNDVNGRYDDSKARKSQYQLNVSVNNQELEDESSLETPIEVENLPYNSASTPLHFLKDDGDDDYFHLTVKESQMVKVNLSGVAGVDSNLSVFTAEQLGLGNDALPDEGMAEKADMGMEEHSIEPLYYQNSEGIGEGETLVFRADPDMDYYVKASNNPNDYFGGYDYYQNPQMEKVEASSSLNPYSLKIEGKVVPEDEDVFPYDGAAGDDGMDNPGEKGLATQRIKIASQSNMEETNPEADFVQMLQDQAMDYQLGDEASGYLQSRDDEDWLQIGADESGLYQFNINPSSSERPLVEIYQLVQPHEDEEDAAPYLQLVGENVRRGWSNAEVSPVLYTVLEQGKQYFVKITFDYISGSLPFDGYSITSKKAAGNVLDRYESNDEFQDAKNLPGASFTANFAKANDQDMYYYTAQKEAIMGVTIDRGTAVKSLKDKFPSDLFAPFYGVAAVLEDVNNNHKLDEEENQTVQVVDHITAEGFTYGSVKVEKGKHYFVVVSGYLDSDLPFTLTPYKFHFSPVNEKDEDKGAVIKNNSSNKPLKLNKVTSRLYTKAGYLNSGVPYGDEDWYGIAVPKKSNVKIRLITGMEVDGTISIYQNGKLIKEADYYPSGDDEIISLPLNKGSYQIKVRDAAGNSSIDPYLLKVYFGK